MVKGFALDWESGGRSNTFKVFDVFRVNATPPDVPDSVTEWDFHDADSLFAHLR